MTTSTSSEKLEIPSDSAEGERASDAAAEKTEQANGAEPNGRNGSPPLYKNSLLATVGYLDLANAMDFPANVWNQHPVPVFAQVLMGLGGSVAILTTCFAFWDIVRSRRNVRCLLDERAYLKHQRCEGKTASPVVEACLGINFRELGWEIVDRMMLDAFMAAAGILVGIGCLMAIRGDIPTVFLASNVLSGYLGNSFNAAYGLINTAWSIYMWRRASMNETATNKAKRKISPDVFKRMQKHARMHKIYATVNGLSMFVSGIGSEVSSTLWPGYVVLIPCIAGSIFCNYFWRHYLGYDRLLLQHRRDFEGTHLPTRLKAILDARAAEGRCSSEPKDPGDTIIAFEREIGVYASYVPGSSENCSPKSLAERSRKYSERMLQGEGRFLLELYGFYLHQERSRSPS